MKKIVPLFALLAGLACAGAALTRADGVAAIANADTCETSHAGLSGDEMAIIDGINEERVAAGMEPYLVSAQISKVAAWMAEDIATSGNFAHVDSVERWPNERGEDCIGLPLGENLAIGFFGGPAGVVEAWMGSSRHKANILNPMYRTVGVGIYGNVYAADFGASTLDGVEWSPGGNPPPPPPPPPPADPTATPTPEQEAEEPPTAVVAPKPAPQPANPGTLSGGASGSRSLEAGVNLVAYTGESRPMSEALGSVSGQLAAVYRWDASSRQWQRYFPGKPAYINSLQWMEAGAAYFIVMNTPATWAY